MARLVTIFVNAINGIFSSVRDYLLEREDVRQDEFQESVENDGSAGIDHREPSPDREKPVLNIHLPSNTGTVIIGDNSNVKYVGAVSVENEQTLTLASTKANLLKIEPTVVNLDKVNKTKRRRRKKTYGKDIAPLKVPSIVRRINEIDKSLSKFRGNGEWLAHDDAVKRFLDEFKGDEDNFDILLLLKYERAAAFFEKNQTESARQLVNEVSKDINENGRSNWEGINDTRKKIYCKCLFLVAKIYCVKKLGKARKALDLASRLICGQFSLKDVELEAELYLAYAGYQFCFNKSHFTSDSVKHVIDYTSNAQDIFTRFRDRSQEKWEETRREILLWRCKAIVQFYLSSEEKQEFLDVFDNSLEELEHQLWSGISLKQKIEFYVLKSDYFNIHGNLAKALDHAQDALHIAQEREFSEDVLQLNDRIRKLKIFPGDAAGDSDRLVTNVLSIQTTTDGNLESNASVAERGIFSTDESD